jgi:hypothetical protein
LVNYYQKNLIDYSEKKAWERGREKKKVKKREKAIQVIF